MPEKRILDSLGNVENEIAQVDTNQCLRHIFLCRID
jgi:hypothetical protein